MVNVRVIYVAQIRKIVPILLVLMLVLIVV